MSDTNSTHIQQIITPIYRDLRLWQTISIFFFIFATFLHSVIPSWPQTNSWRAIDMTQVGYLDDTLLLLLLILFIFSLVQSLFVCWTFPLLSTYPIIALPVADNNHNTNSNNPYHDATNYHLNSIFLHHNIEDNDNFSHHNMYYDNESIDSNSIISETESLFPIVSSISSPKIQQQNYLPEAQFLQNNQLQTHLLNDNDDIDASKKYWNNKTTTTKKEVKNDYKHQLYYDNTDDDSDNDNDDNDDGNDTDDIDYDEQQNYEDDSTLLRGKNSLYNPPSSSLQFSKVSSFSINKPYAQKSSLNSLTANKNANNCNKNANINSTNINNKLSTAKPSNQVPKYNTIKFSTLYPPSKLFQHDSSQKLQKSQLLLDPSHADSIFNPNRQDDGGPNDDQDLEHTYEQRNNYDKDFNSEHPFQHAPSPCNRKIRHQKRKHQKILENQSYISRLSAKFCCYSQYGYDSRQKTCKTFCLPYYLWFQLFLCVIYLILIIVLISFAYTWTYIVISSYFFQNGFIYTTQNQSSSQYVVTTSAGASLNSLYVIITSCFMGIFFFFMLILLFANILLTFRRFKISFLLYIILHARHGITLYNTLSTYLANIASFTPKMSNTVFSENLYHLPSRAQAISHSLSQLYQQNPENNDKKNHTQNENKQQQQQQQLYQPPSPLQQQQQQPIPTWYEEALTRSFLLTNSTSLLPQQQSFTLSPPVPQQLSKSQLSHHESTLLQNSTSHSLLSPSSPSIQQSSSTESIQQSFSSPSISNSVSPPPSPPVLPQIVNNYDYKLSPFYNNSLLYNARFYLFSHLSYIGHLSWGNVLISAIFAISVVSPTQIKPFTFHMYPKLIQNQEDISLIQYYYFFLFPILLISFFFLDLIFVFLIYYYSDHVMTTSNPSQPLHPYITRHDISHIYQQVAKSSLFPLLSPTLPSKKDIIQPIYCVPSKYHEVGQILPLLSNTTFNRSLSPQTIQEQDEEYDDDIDVVNKIPIYHNINTTNAIFSNTTNMNIDPLQKTSKYVPPTFLLSSPTPYQPNITPIQTNIKNTKNNNISTKSSFVQIPPITPVIIDTNNDVNLPASSAPISPTNINITTSSPSNIVTKNNSNCRNVTSESPLGTNLPTVSSSTSQNFLPSSSHVSIMHSLSFSSYQNDSKLLNNDLFSSISNNNNNLIEFNPDRLSSPFVAQYESIILSSLQKCQTPINFIFYYLYIFYYHFFVIRVVMVLLLYLLWLHTIWSLMTLITLQNFHYSQDHYLSFLSTFYHQVTWSFVMLVISTTFTSWLFMIMGVNHLKRAFFPAQIKF